MGSKRFRFVMFVSNAYFRLRESEWALRRTNVCMLFACHAYPHLSTADRRREMTRRERGGVRERTGFLPIVPSQGFANPDGPEEAIGL
jgi:hypothetical protein